MAARRRDAPSLPACCTHDLVQRVPADGEAPKEEDIGLVWRVAGEEDSEDDYSVSSEDEEPDERPERLPDGHAQVAWLPSGWQQQQPAADASFTPLEDGARAEAAVEAAGARGDRMDTRVTEGLTVIDRCFNVGDVVASAADPTGQTAVVVRVDRRCDVRLSDGSRLQRQPVAHLQPIVPHFLGQPVLCLGWLGRVDEVYETVSVRLDAGGSVQCSGHEGDLPLAFPADPRQMLFVEAGGCRFYPGQRVVVEPAQSGGWGGRRRAVGPERPGTVTSVRVTELLVDWVANVGGLLADRPGDHVSPGDCLPLRSEPWQASAWHLGLHAFWRGPEPAAAAAAASAATAPDEAGAAAAGEAAGEALSMEADAAASGSGSEADDGGGSPPAEQQPRGAGGWGSYAKRLISTGLSQGGQKRARRGNKRKKQRRQRTAQVLRTHTAVDVVWQDGTAQAGLPALALLPRVHLDERDFWPDDFVALERDSLDGEAAGTGAPGARVGVVRRCNAKERTAEVAWLATGEHGFLLPAPPDAPTQTLPVYRLQAHPAFNYQVGDIVLRCDPPGEAEVPLLGSVGEVLSSRGGVLSLRLASGEAVQLMPDRVVLGSAGDDYDEEPYEGEEEEGASEASGSWSTCSDPEEAAGAEAGEEASEEAGRQLPGAEAEAAEDKRFESWSTALDAAAAAATGAEPGAEDAAAAAAEATAQREPCLASEVGKVSLASPAQAPQPQQPQQPHEAGEAGVPAAAAEQNGATSPAAADGGEGPAAASPLAEALGFPHFAVDEECPEDHAFKAAAGRPSRRFQAAVLAEWRSLERNLPASIWVRAYESRMDLMRFAVLAAADTPYAGHLFLFDLQLPPDYPASPPTVLYHSWGLRVNPNLYENGKVCLSLLGTWTGARQEMWTPESTLLQLVVSIQGLILVPKPYFNEAGFERQTGSVEGEANSVLYNEQAALLTVRSAVHLLRRPPAGFAGFVRGYYKREAAALLAPLQRVVDGGEAAPSSTGAEGEQWQADAAPPASAGFRLMLRELLPRFRAALDAL